eukprot:626145-Rhodomonas_salina.3
MERESERASESDTTWRVGGSGVDFFCRSAALGLWREVRDPHQLPGTAVCRVSTTLNGFLGPPYAISVPR